VRDGVKVIQSLRRALVNASNEVTFYLSERPMSLQRWSAAMIDVLYEDNHLLAVNKPAMLPTMGVAEDRDSLLAMAKEYIRQKFAKPGNVYLGIVSRLDAPVTGVVMIARTSKAAARLSKQFRERDVDKSYWAIVEGPVEPTAGRLIDFLRKDERHRRMHVTGPNARDAQRAELAFRTLGAGEGEPRLRDGANATLLEVRPVTGRKHQIRVQLAAAGVPILGDRKYGSQRGFPAGIALHARRLVVDHPVLKTEVTIEAPLPGSWRGFVK
jgi:23S rRNA pseudouridine1911/1915/1917 synthase